MYTTPKISVIVPVYNVQDYLAACLESLCGQTLKELEIIVVNDGSTDGSVQIIQNFKAQHPHLICLEQPNAGLGAARNTGLKAVAGAYTAFVDADDYVSPDYFEKLYAAAERAKADICYASFSVYDEQTGKTGVADDAALGSLVLAGSTKAAVYDHFSLAMSACGRIVRSGLLSENKIAFEEGAINEDIIPSARMLCAARLLTSEPLAIYYYRINRPGSITTRKEETFPNLLQALNGAREVLLQNGCYAGFAPKFEYLRLVCVLSFIFTYGLNEANWNALKACRESFLEVPGRLFKGRELGFRLKFLTLKACLRHNVNSYPALVKRSKKYVYNPLKQFFGKF